ncbi:MULTISPECIES: helix-turn-helix domain-containing protein [unclassified Streptomyces]|uniref:helix-turn-helix domain-containing protein n=1 Tax=unclassified Streptomyces TaxID=2593676 RepID=UPI002E79E854|nr:helix-turn-helix domain-containing protein [Streptomyces sp. JV184]MEE1744499.1 helix-turn-helix domain-containing protein [Streptomyces sp. JV184]
MSDENRRTASAGPPSQRARQSLPDHPLRVALLDLLAEVGTVTSTQAAARLGHSSGLCSFHLRQLARHGLIEEAPHKGGRARPWRLRWDSPHRSGQEAPEEFDVLARGLEDESYQHWLAHRDQAPAEWQHDESFSAVVHLTPAEMTELAASIRLLLADYRERDRHPATRPAGTVAVAAVTRLFPLLAENPVPPPPAPRRGADGATD